MATRPAHSGLIHTAQGIIVTPVFVSVGNWGQLDNEDAQHDPGVRPRQRHLLLG
jgi:hypothetical protein